MAHGQSSINVSPLHHLRGDRRRVHLGKISNSCSAWPQEAVRSWDEILATLKESEPYLSEKEFSDLAAYLIAPFVSQLVLHYTSKGMKKALEHWND